MQRSELQPTSWTDDDYLATVREIATGSPDARPAAAARLRSHVAEYTESFVPLPIGGLDGSESARREIVKLVLERLERNDHEFVKQWRRRMLYGADPASFRTMLDTMIIYMAIKHARAMELVP